MSVTVTIPAVAIAAAISTIAVPATVSIPMTVAVTTISVAITVTSYGSSGGRCAVVALVFQESAGCEVRRLDITIVHNMSPAFAGFVTIDEILRCQAVIGSRR